jgi:Zn-dependent protease
MIDHLNLTRILEYLPGIILGLTVHEASHAYVAQLCGDTTSKEQGRVSLNPLRHIDLLGFIMLIVAGFGWAKPVQFNELNLKNPRKDVIRISLAGPGSNALLAILLSLTYTVVMHFFPGYHNRTMLTVDNIFMYAIYINWGLFVFNLIPIPPLDGSHLLLTYFRRFPALYAGFYRYGSYFFFGIILVMVVTGINLLPIMPAVQFLGNGVLSLFGSMFGG